MAQMSFYDVLLVDQNATLDEIKVAFKRRALQVHPDKGGSKEEFHLVYQALETLADPTARKKYDHGLATKAGISTGPKRNQRKKADQNTHTATSSKTETKKQPQMPGKRPTSFAGKASSKSTQATATSAEPQSKQTKLLMKIRDLLKQLPRDARNDVITNQFSQKQRVILEKWMADNAATSSGTKCHSEAKALAPAAAESAPHQPGFATSSTKTPESMMVAVSDSSPGRRFASKEKTRNSKRVRSTREGICNEPLGVTTSLTVEASDARSSPSEVTEAQTKAPHPRDMKSNHPMHVTLHEGGYALARPCAKLGCISDVKLTRRKQSAKVNNQDKKKACNTKARNSGYVRRGNKDSTSYNAGICFDSLEMNARNCDLKTALEDLVILTAVKQKMRNQIGTGTFTERLQAALVSSAAEHGRSLPDLKLSFMVFQSAACFIGPQLRSPSVRSLETFGEMRSVLEPFRKYAKNLGSQNVFWLYSPIHLEDAWQRFQSAVAHTWEIAGVDDTAILQKIRSLHDARAPLRSAGLQRWERQHMARQDKNRHRPKKLRERNSAARLECWERRRMAMQDKDKHRPKKLRQNLQLRKCTSESRLSRKLSAVKKLVARWGQMLKREEKLVDKERQKAIKQRKAQQKKDQDEQRRVEALKQKREREEERLRRERLRKRMRSDVTMDDILSKSR